jgi:uncharacterized FlgJ-related protein
MEKCYIHAGKNWLSKKRQFGKNVHVTVEALSLQAYLVNIYVKARRVKNRNIVKNLSIHKEESVPMAVLVALLW